MGPSAMVMYGYTEPHRALVCRFLWAVTGQMELCTPALGIIAALHPLNQRLYSSSRLVTLGLLSLRLLLAEELLWGKVAQGLVRTHCVIGKLPKAELLVQGSDLQGKVIDLIELLGMGTLCPFHGTIELGRARWQYEEAKASLLTRLFKARLELGASVHLYSSYWEGHPGLQGT